MKTSGMKSRLLKFLFMLLPITVVADEAARLKELDDLWAIVSRTVRTGDFEAYASTYHPDAVLVSGVKKMSQPIAEALKRWKHEFTDTATGKMKASVEFRFSQRLGDDTTALESGIFLYSFTGDDGQWRKEYIHFECLMVKRDGWKVLMEHQKSKATEQEWEALGGAAADKKS